MTEILTRFKHLINTIPAFLKEFSDEKLNYKPAPDKWSKKEIIGHLIDSAANNHHRFIRAQYESTPIITYNQDQWVKCNYYQQRDSAQLINLWLAYNQNLLAIFKLMPEENLSLMVGNGSPQPVTLGFVIEDYVHHLEHHVGQLFDTYE